MARITVEDCLKKINNKFSLVIAGVKRAKQILRGEPLLIENKDNNKPVVVALREIANEKVFLEETKQKIKK